MFTSLIPNILHVSLKNVGINDLPWSVNKVDPVPCRVKDLRGVHSCTGLCGDVRDRLGFDPFGKVIYKGQQVFLRGVTKYGPVISMDVTSEGDEGSSVFPNGATNSLSSSRL